MITNISRRQFTKISLIFCVKALQTHKLIFAYAVLVAVVIIIFKILLNSLYKSQIELICFFESKTSCLCLCPILILINLITQRSAFNLRFRLSTLAAVVAASVR